jgi:type 1 glutamine amidotransferase
VAKHVVFMIGEAEYESQDAMPAVAAEAEKKLGVRTTVCTSDPIAKPPDGETHSFPGIEALADADLLVVYTRFRVLPDEEMETLKKYLSSGRPVVGLRTSTHSFRFPEGSPWRSWNDGFGTDLFGTAWKTHYGGKTNTDVRKEPAAVGHPILEGVEDTFHIRSWLYHVLPLPDTCKPLLWGKVVGDTADLRAKGREAVDNPVAYTNTPSGLGKGGRVFYTSLGHKDDFEAPSLMTLLMNGIAWAMEGGAD